MTARLVRFADLTPVPWKNGGGITREIAVYPEGSDFANFEWRLSMADVETAGVFSQFEGVDRHLLVLKGSLRLTSELFDIAMEAGDGLKFNGETAVEAVPTNGAVRNLNVMTRRAFYTSRVSTVGAEDWIRTAGVPTWIAARRETSVAGRILQPFDVLQCDIASRTDWHIDFGDAIVVSLLKA